MAIFVEHLQLAISVFCIFCELETPNEAVFQYLYVYASYNNKCSDILEETCDIYYVTVYKYGHSTIMWLLCK